MNCIQHSFMCRHSDSTVSDDVGIEPTTFVAARRSNWKVRAFCILDRETRLPPDRYQIPDTRYQIPETRCEIVGEPQARLLEILTER
jgi:hypothetical protein